MSLAAASWSKASIIILALKNTSYSSGSTWRGCKFQCIIQVSRIVRWFWNKRRSFRLVRSLTVSGTRIIDWLRVKNDGFKKTRRHCGSGGWSVTNWRFRGSFRGASQWCQGPVKDWYDFGTFALSCQMQRRLSVTSGS